MASDHLEADLRRVREKVAMKNKLLQDQASRQRNPFVAGGAGTSMKSGAVVPPGLSKKASEASNIAKIKSLWEGGSRQGSLDEPEATASAPPAPVPRRTSVPDLKAAHARIAAGTASSATTPAGHRASANKFLDDLSEKSEDTSAAWRAHVTEVPSEAPRPSQAAVRVEPTAARPTPNIAVAVSTLDSIAASSTTNSTARDRWLQKQTSQSSVDGVERRLSQPLLSLDSNQGQANESNVDDGDDDDDDGAQAAPQQISPPRQAAPINVIHEEDEAKGDSQASAAPTTVATATTYDGSGGVPAEDPYAHVVMRFRRRSSEDDALITSRRGTVVGSAGAVQARKNLFIKFAEKSVAEKSLADQLLEASAVGNVFF